MNDDDELTCPFCGEPEFDRIGLKIHLWYERCDVFNATPTECGVTLRKVSPDAP